MYVYIYTYIFTAKTTASNSNAASPSRIEIGLAQNSNVLCAGGCVRVYHQNRCKNFYYVQGEVETVVVTTLQEEATVRQEYFNQAAFGKPIEPVLACNNNIELPFWDRPPLAGIGELYDYSDRYRPVNILNRVGSVAPNVGYMHQDHETSISKLFKILGVPTCLYARDNSMKASSSYYVLTCSNPMPSNAAAAWPAQPAGALMPGAINITRDMTALNQNVYGNKDNPTSFTEHAIFGIFSRRLYDPNPQNDPAYNWVAWRADTAANRALLVAANTAACCTIGGAPIAAAKHCLESLWCSRQILQPVLTGYQCRSTMYDRAYAQTKGWRAYYSTRHDQSDSSTTNW